MKLNNSLMKVVQRIMERIWSVKKYWSKVLLLRYYVSVNKYGVNCGTSLRFGENKGWIKEIDPKENRS